MTQRGATATRSTTWLLTLVVGALCLAVGSPGPVARAADDTAEVLTVVRGDSIAEASGLVADHRSAVLFVVQDAGFPPHVHTIGDDGSILQTTVVPGVTNDDWEDLAAGEDETGRPVLYIGDIGDAAVARSDAGLGSRREFAVIRIARPDPGAVTSEEPVEADDVRMWRFDYADGLYHNAETLLVEPGTNRIYVVEKTADPEVEAMMWVAPEVLADDGVNTFEPVGPVPVTGASAGSFSPSGRHLVIRDADRAHVWKVVDGDVAASLETPPTRVPLPSQRQGEGIDFLPDGESLVVNSEGRNQPVYRIPLPPELHEEPGPAPEAGDDADGRVPTPSPEADEPVSASGVGAGSVDDPSGPPLLLMGGVVLWLCAVGGVIWYRRGRARPR